MATEGKLFEVMLLLSHERRSRFIVAVWTTDHFFMQQKSDCSRIKSSFSESNSKSAIKLDFTSGVYLYHARRNHYRNDLATAGPMGRVLRFFYDP
uniref:Uncharacterized protein n=1 Tax=Romanomermis culicivorax TaxID=13658 RepID=A0A915I256_ROMCU